MNDTKYLWILLFIFPLPVLAQTSKLQRQLEQSEYLTYTMKPDSADAGLTRWLRKKPSLSQELELAKLKKHRTRNHTGKPNIQPFRQRQYSFTNAGFPCCKKSHQPKLCNSRTYQTAGQRKPGTV